MTVAILLQCVLFLTVLAVATCQSALRLLGTQELEDAGRSDGRKAGRLSAMKMCRGGFDHAARTMQVFFTLLAGAASFAGISVPAAERLAAVLPVVPHWLLLTALTLAAVCLVSFFHVAIAFRLAQGFAVKDAQGSAFRVCTPVYALFILLTPLIRLNTAAGALLVKGIGVEPEMEAAATEDDIRLMAESGSLKGAIDSQENEFIQNVFEFNDVPVEEILTHRTDVVCLYEDESDEEWEKTVFENRHSYFVICGEDTDDIAGVLDAKTYIRMADRSREKVREKCILKPYLVPESMKAATLFANMKKTGNFFAVVIDEYGGMAGIVTMRDLLELIVGEWTEKDEEQEPDDIVRLSDDTFMVRGVAPLDEVAEALGAELPTEEFDTFGGFVFGQLGYVPDDGSSVSLTTAGLAIEVKKIEDHRIEEAMVKVDRTEGEDAH